MNTNEQVEKHAYLFEEGFLCSGVNSREVLPPGNSPNWHDYLEVAHVTRGQGIMHLGGRAFPLTAGDFVVAGDKELHWMEPAPRKRMTLEAIFFQREFIAPITVGPESSILLHMYDTVHEHKVRVLSPGMPGQVEALWFFNQLRSETPLHHADSRLAMRCHLLELLLHIQRGLGIDLSAKPSTHPTDSRISIVIEHVRKNYAGKLTREDLAQRACVSEAYLSRYFKMQTGMSLTRFIDEVRAEVAAKLLRSTSMPVNQIASRVGIDSISNFHRVFHSIAGTTPGKYRKGH